MIFKKVKIKNGIQPEKLLGHWPMRKGETDEKV